MVYLTMLSLSAALIYFLIGFNVFRLYKRSAVCKIFFLLTLSLTIWSLPGAFVYLAENTVEYAFWNKISALGWCTFEAIALYFVMTLTENKLMRYWYIKLLILLPAGIFLYMVLFLFGPDIQTSPTIENVFYKGNFLYNFLYSLLSIVLILRWGIKSKSQIQRKQAYIISISSAISFLLTLFIQTILPALGLLDIPDMGQVYTAIMFCGVFYAINRYQFMSIPTSLITNKLFEELTGLAFLLDPQGYVIKTNRQISHLLNYTDDEMIGRHITEIIKHEEFDRIMESSETILETVRLNEIILSSKTGRLIPFKISVIPLQIKHGIQIGLLMIGEDVSITKELFDEIEKRKLTNERLINSEKIFRTLLEITPVPIVLTSKRTGRMIYMNAEAQELFEADKTELIGKHITDFFEKSEDQEEFFQSLMNVIEIKNKEIMIRTKNNSELLVMLTMVTSVYQGEEISLSCVIDITNQKKTEEMLKQNNDNINKLNDELVEMNNILMQKSNRDSLTNLYNHQYINKVLENLLIQVSKDSMDICIMMLDIDYFKQVNDCFGHQVGDKVLVTISELIKNNIRTEDYIGRYGGEEFLVVMPNINLEAAILTAEKIRSTVQSCDFSDKGLAVTISIGVVQYEGETSKDLVNKADTLLYQAKAKGRNRYESVLEGE